MGERIVGGSVFTDDTLVGAGTGWAGCLWPGSQASDRVEYESEPTTSADQVAGRVREHTQHRHPVPDAADENADPRPASPESDSAVRPRYKARAQKQIAPGISRPTQAAILRT